MNTSKLVLRPYMPTGMLATGDEKEDGELREKLKADFGNLKREQYATLSYGNVTIELDYTIFIRLSLDVGHQYDREKQIFNLGKEEILQEMNINAEGLDKPSDNSWFRDNPDKCSITHPWSPLCRESDNWTSIVDGRRTMVWDKLDKEQEQ